MPTKLGKGGHGPQEYVPEGNGKASGTYADDNGVNIYGSFKNFKKPNDSGQTTGQTQETNTINQTPTDNTTYDPNKWYYYKKGNKWYMIRGNNIEWYKQNYPKTQFFTREEHLNKITEDNKKVIETSQTAQDKEIGKMINDNCVVCFGKGFKEETLNQIKKDTGVLINDFPQLKNTIRMMGDANNLEKYLNALKQSGDDINNQNLPSHIQRLKNTYAYWDYNKKMLVYMGIMKKDNTERRKYEFENNFKSSDKPNATFNHEMGHAIDTAIQDYYQQVYKKSRGTSTSSKIDLQRIKFKNDLSDLYEQNYNSQYQQEFDKINEEMHNGIKLYGISNETKRQIENRLKEKGIKRYVLSQYGSTNIDEFIAESFSAYYTGMNNDLANKVVKLFKDYSDNLRRWNNEL